MLFNLAAGETNLPSMAGEIIGKLTENITTADIISVIGSIIAIAAAFVFLWWGGRKGVKVLLQAIKTGKLKF